MQAVEHLHLRAGSRRDACEGFAKLITGHVQKLAQSQVAIRSPTLNWTKI